MIAMQCGACGKSVSVDEHLGHNQRCPLCGGPVGRIPLPPVSTALSDLQDGELPVRFGAYSKAAEEKWDDPLEPRVDEQVERRVVDEAKIDNAVLNVVPPEVEARFRARQREARKKLVGLGLVVAVAVIGLIVFVLY